MGKQYTYQSFSSLRYWETTVNMKTSLLVIFAFIFIKKQNNNDKKH